MADDSAHVHAHTHTHMHAHTHTHTHDQLLLSLSSAERPITVSFDSSHYRVNEGDTLVVGFMVTGDTGVGFTGTVTVTASNGTAMSE